ncbi:MAG: biopolymer transporter ExbD [Deltaproteobacteria bacterium]|nr:biopolymer transporter ExbD [Deltaproteobacteria bacterium]
MAHGIDITDDLKHDMNVIPLIDVMLVLLIIFMITAPHLQHSLKVDPPKAKATTAKGKGEQLVVTIDKNGTIYLGSDNVVEIGQIAKTVKAILQNRSEDNRKVFIKADKEANYGAVLQLLGELASEGITDINLVASPVK